MHAVARIRYRIDRAGQVVIGVHDVTGQRVRAMGRGEFAAGEHEAVWDGRDDAGRPSPAGVYFVRVTSAGRSRTARVLRF
jgi:flagellar hook assembly protein FlgD